MPLLTRRHFGSLAMGAAVYSILGGCASKTGALSAMQPAIMHAPDDGLSRATPESQGISSDSILAFLNDVEQQGLELHSFMLMRNSHVVAEGWWWPYNPSRIHMTHSATKSMTAVAVGLALAEKRFSLDDTVVSFFPEYVPADASDYMKQMTVRDLLVMKTGHAVETSGSKWRPINTSWVAEFFKIPVVYKPGTKFKYTSAATYMLSAIVSKTTGQSAEEYLVPRFFDPLQITQWEWDTSPGGISTGANGLSLQTSGLLKLGAVHAQNGMWNGNQILPKSWVKAATRRHSVGEDEYGYGYQWWMGPKNAYYALGLFTQLSIVFPEHNATLAIFSAIDGSSKLKPTIWKHFPAAFVTGTTQWPDGSAKPLQHKIASLRVLPELKPTTPAKIENTISGKRYKFQNNDQTANWVSFEFIDNCCIYNFSDENGVHTVKNGFETYIEQDTSITGNRLHHQYHPDYMRAVAGARWLNPNKLELTWQFVETAFRDTLVCIFEGNTVRIDRSVNLNTQETNLPTLTGVSA
ncbi:serine hydrolase domain-containing protein [Kordiimonas pumila]|uniref:Serine hydrolase domain-containing protein n=1 Tax=Kordiimonas pumila TaxID=2161677 RepID=A0ABV7D8E5_9PROT|nr:serine hydrolase [Kordiimonas pumila]